MTLRLDNSTWKRVLLSDVARHITDRADPETSSLERFLAGEHIGSQDLHIRTWGVIGEDPIGPMFYKRFKPGHVLYVSRRSYLRKTAVPDFEGICGEKTFVLETKDESRLLQHFLPFVLSAERFHEFAIRMSRGSVNPYINWTDLAAYEFELPSLDEQKCLADLLWALEGERQAASSLAAAISRVRDAVIDERFVGRGQGILQDLCDESGIRIGPFGAQLHAHDYVEDGPCPVVMPQDMLDGSISTYNIQRIAYRRAEDLAVHRLKAGDVLLPRRGELNRRALVTEDEEGWLCGTGSVRIRVRPGVPARAVFLALSSAATVAWLRRNATGTTMPNLNAGIVARIPIALPDDAMLEVIFNQVDVLDRVLGVAQARLASAEGLAKAILEKIFGGME